VTLATAQLAIAREHGCASWVELKEEVERRTRPLRGWPEVAMLEPGPSGGTTFLPDGIALATEPLSVARGTAEETPFEVRAYETKPQLGAEWWDVEYAVGPDGNAPLRSDASCAGGSGSSLGRLVRSNARIRVPSLRRTGRAAAGGAEAGRRSQVREGRGLKEELHAATAERDDMRERLHRGGQVSRQGRDVMVV
jgi:hypothetical protein